MSGSYTNTDGRSESLNEGAAHDTGLYDPNRYDNQIVAVYETRARAQAAKDALLAAGVPESAIQVLDRAEGDAVGGVTRAEDRNQDEGFWGAIKNLFVPDEDRNAYGYAIDRGHAMVLVVPSAGMDRQRVIEVLEASDPIDFDAKLEEWRQAGYDYSSAPRATERGRMEPTASSGGAGTGYKTGADTSGAISAQTTGTSKTTGTAQTTAARTGATATQGLAGNAETIKVVEEIGIRKEASDRTETVRDTVRETKVEVDDKAARTGRTGATGVSGTTGAGMGTGGTTTNATPGATSSGTNSPRK